MQEMDHSLNTTATRDKCFVEVPVLLLLNAETAILVNIIANSLLVITAIFGNVSILLSFAMVSSLRSTSNYLLLGLALTDLGVGLVVQPSYIFVLFSLYNNGVPHCTVIAVYSIATSLLGGVSLLYMTVIGIDKYLAIRLHLRYRELVTEKRTNIIQIAVWMTNALLTMVWLKGFHVYSTLAAVVVAISLFLTFAIYVKLYVIVKQHKAQIHSQIVTQTSQFEVPRQSQMVTQTTQFEISRLKRLRKSAINTMYVFFTFLLCYLPFFVATAINNMFSSPKKEGIVVYEFTVTLMLSNSSLNPLMYCLRLREFRTAVRKTYRRIFCMGSADD